MEISPTNQNCSILDIDLDYFNYFDDPLERLRALLVWAGRPVDFKVEKHHKVLRQWNTYIKNNTISIPTHILHVDEHHDMMDEKVQPNIANVIFQAMSRWPSCRVHWLVEEPIDSPSMWLSEETWTAIAPRFSMGRVRPRGWPKPHFVSICTSPDFVGRELRERLCAEISRCPYRLAGKEGAGK